MAQFKAYENPNKATRKIYPYLLDIQSNLLSELRSTLVIPLISSNIAGKVVISKLNPTLEVNGKKFIALTQQMAGVDRKHLGKEVADLVQYRPDIIAALDFIIAGI